MIDNYYHGMPWVPVEKRMPEPMYPEKYLTTSALFKQQDICMRWYSGW